MQSAQIGVDRGIDVEPLAIRTGLVAGELRLARQFAGKKLQHGHVMHAIDTVQRRLQPIKGAKTQAV